MQHFLLLYSILALYAANIYATENPLLECEEDNERGQTCEDKAHKADIHLYACIALKPVYLERCNRVLIEVEQGTEEV